MGLVFHRDIDLFASSNGPRAGLAFALKGVEDRWSRICWLLTRHRHPAPGYCGPTSAPLQLTHKPPRHDAGTLKDGKLGSVPRASLEVELEHPVLFLHSELLTRVQLLDQA